MKQSLNDIAEAVIRKLSGKVIIHRYDSFSTNSIYLKFDYGVANSLRISDHDGKKHLKCRYNILESMSNMPVKTTATRNGFEMVFYSPAMINACCRDILAAKADRMKRYRDYDAIVAEAKQKAARPQKGFWSGARLVSDRKDTVKKDDQIKQVVDFMKAQQAAEEEGKQEFTCPLCGGTAVWGRSSYNNHLHCSCTGCGMRMME